MRIVIFGCGIVAKKTYGFLGAERVDFFCDNNIQNVGKKLYNKPILSYKEMLELGKKQRMLLILGVNGYNAQVIARQLLKDGIENYVVAKYIPGFDERERITEEDFMKLCEETTQLKLMIRFLNEEVENERAQNQYLKKHTDITALKPATGFFRKKQLECVEQTKKVLAFLENNCPIECWITGGTLIGSVRHGGFIPWDDDIDFGIMRKDIYNLIQFFKDYSAVVIPGKCPCDGYEGRASISKYDTFEEALRACNKEYILGIHPDFMHIYTLMDNKLRVALELFPFDFYKDTTTIEQYKQYVSEGFRKKKEFNSYKEWFEYCYDKIENSGLVSLSPTQKILPGIDSFIYRGLWNIDKFLSYDTVFPLKQIEFEGIQVNCVNDAIHYMPHEYPDWKEYPEMFNLSEIQEE